MATLITRLALQTRRRAELDAIRLDRALTPAEQAEADRLADRLYMREWRRTFGNQRARTPHHGA
jgi:hypothetical protein